MVETQLLLRTTDYFNLIFLLTTALRKFAYRSGFNQIVRRCPHFTGKAPDRTAGNRLTFLKNQKGWLNFKPLSRTENVYYLTEKGLVELQSMLLHPKTYFRNNPQLASWIENIGLSMDQLPAKPLNPGNRDFRAHEQLCDDISAAWTATVGRCIRLKTQEGAERQGQIDFVWCMTEQSIAVDMGRREQTIIPDLLLYVNCTVDDTRFTRVAAIEVEVSTGDWVRKTNTYIQWFWDGGFRRFYQEQQARFPLRDHAAPPLIVGFLFPTSHEEARARAQLRKRLRVSDDGRPLSMVRTSHTGYDLARCAWKPLHAEGHDTQERIPLFRSGGSDALVLQ